MNEVEHRHRLNVINAPIRLLNEREQKRLITYVRSILYDSLVTANMSYNSEFGPVTFGELCSLTDFNPKDRGFRFNVINKHKK